MNQSYIDKYLPNAQFSEAYSGTSNADIEHIYHQMFSETPKWVDSLQKLRDFLVSPFGLKTIDELQREDKVQPDMDAGQTIHGFKVYYKDETTIVAGGDDKHLDFRIVLTKNNHHFELHTLVKTNNWLGRIYFFFILPFHKLIVSQSVKKASK